MCNGNKLHGYSKKFIQDRWSETLKKNVDRVDK